MFSNFISIITIDKVLSSKPKYNVSSHKQAPT